MIDRFLRRLTVRQRIIGGFVILLLLMSLGILAFFAARITLTDRLQEVTELENRADRLLLLASTRVASSRINLMRYVVDYLPSVQDSLDDADEAIRLLTEAVELGRRPEQEADVLALMDKLVQYKTLVNEIQAARVEGRSEEVSGRLFRAYRLGTDVGQQIEQIVQESEIRVEQAHQEVFEKDQARMVVLLAGYAGVLVLALLLASLLQRSITRPVAELRSAAETFQRGRLDMAVPVVGNDELSLLAQTFNQMADQLSRSYQELEQRVADRTRELERRSRYLEASAGISRAAASILDADELIQRSVRLVKERFDLYYVGLFQLDEAGEWAVLRAGTGQAGQAMLDRGHRIQVGEGMVGWCVANAQWRVALEAGQDAVRLATEELPETRSEAALPLRSRGRVVGALTVQSDQPGAFDQDTMVVLQTMADQVAVALDNARLFAASQARLEELRRAYGEFSRQAWEEVSRKGQGYRYDPLGGVSPDDTWYPGMRQALQSARVVQDEADRPQSDEAARRLAIPVRVQDQVIGAIGVRKPADLPEWTPEEISLLETLVERVGTALESARLYQDTQRRAVRERLVAEVTDKMRRSVDMEDLIKTAVQEMSDAFGTSNAFVQLNVPSRPSEPPVDKG